MGKGYMQWHEVGGTDLRSHFEAAFKRQVRAFPGSILDIVLMHTGSHAHNDSTHE